MYLYPITYSYISSVFIYLIQNFMNPQPQIIRTQGHNNNKFGKMNLYEAFQQVLFVPQKKEQNWYLTSAEMLPH